MGNIISFWVVFAAVTTIVVNGASRKVANGATLQQLLDSLQLDARQIAVERNREIVSKSRYSETALRDGDRLEIVTFVGGG